MKLFRSTCREAGVIIWVQFLEGPPPKIQERQKIVQNFARFLTTFDFDREYLRNGSTCRKSENQFINYHPSHVGSKKLVYFGPQTKKLLSLMYIDHNVLFSGNHISALRGCCPSKFLHALEIDQGLIAHTTTGTGSPQKKINRENLKFG